MKALVIAAVAALSFSLGVYARAASGPPTCKAAGESCKETAECCSEKCVNRACQ